MHSIPTNSHAARLALLMALLFVCSGSVIAFPVADYQQNLKNAIATLNELYETDEDEDPDDYQARLNETLDSVRTALPKNQTVEAGADVYDVDNAWLHRALDELKETKDRPQKIEEIIERLQAIEARVAERQNAMAGAGTKDESKAKLESILGRPEYVTGAQGPNALTRLIRDFLHWLLKFLPKRKPAEPASVKWINAVARILVVIVGLVVLVFVVKLLMTRFKRSGKIKPRKKQEARIVLGERLEPEQTATDLLSEAEALARSGDLRAAIRKAYIALLVELGDRKLISLAQHKTNRDYLNSVRSVPLLHSRMRGLTDSFERHWYGFVEANQSDWQSFRDGYLATLQTGN